MKTNSEYREGTGFSEQPVPWILFIFIALVFLVTTLDWDYSHIVRDSTLREVMAVNLAKGSPMRRVLYSLLGLYGIASVMRQGADRFRVSGLSSWSILFFVTWALLSVTWSTEVGLSIRRLVAFLALGFGAMGISRRMSPRMVGMLVFFCSSVYLVFGVLAELFHGVFEPFSSTYRFAGTQHPNNQAVNCSLLVLSGVIGGDLVKSLRRLLYLGAGVGFVFLILTGSRTSFASTAVAILAVTSLVQRTSKNTLIVFIVVLALLVSFLVLGEATGLILGEGAHLGRRAEGAGSLNSRIWLWMECRSHAGQRQLQGYGFDGFWSPERIKAISDSQGWNIEGGHSVYVDLVLNLGMVGFTLFVVVLAAAIKKSRREFKLTGDLGYGFFFGFLIFYVLHGTLESIFIASGYFSFVSLIVFVSLGFSRSPRGMMI